MATDPRNIRLLALDVDGVLTDGSIMIDDHGQETKRFDVKDGLGITTWLRLGLEVAVVTKRSGNVVKVRCRELGITRIIQGCSNKAAAIVELQIQTGIPPEHMAFVGDDWPDLPALRVVGYPIAVADAAPEVREVAAYITTRTGGHGAVREVVEHLLRAKGLMQAAIDHHR